VEVAAETRRTRLSITSSFALIHASCQTDERIVFVDHDGMGTTSKGALEAAWVLAPLGHVPGTITNWPPSATRGGAR
jgi:hypothetical protein